MTTQRKNFDRAYKLHAACALRETRPELSYISFRDGYAYTNNGSMVVKADLRRISTFHPDEYRIIEGKSIHMDNFRRLLNYKVANVTERGFEVNDQGKRMLIYFNDQTTIEYEDEIQDIFLKCSTSALVGLHKTGIRASQMRTAAQVLGSDTLRVDFYDGGNGRLLTRLSPVPLLGKAETVIYKEVVCHE